jgi:hypothetical protein
MPCGSIIQLKLIADSDCAKDFATFKANLHLIGKVESNWLNPAKEAVEMAFINPALTSGALGQFGNVSKEMGSHGFDGISRGQSSRFPFPTIEVGNRETPC